MNTELSMPGYRANEYLLVLSPHEELRHKISGVKKSFFENYGVQSALMGRPQITLARFTQLEMMEDRLMNKLRLISMGLPSIKIELNGFGNYPTHSIFINVVNKNQVKNIINGFKEARRLMKRGGENPHFIDDPCIPVAIRIQKEVFKEALKEYASKHFTGRFIADHILVLKRRKGEIKYQVLERMALQYLPVHTLQGALF